MNKCGTCNSINISEYSELESLVFKGTKIMANIEFTVCNDCNQEFISSQQITNNEAKMRDAKKHADGLMTSKEIYNARTQLDLTQEEAAKVFGGGKNAFSKYERAEVSQSVAMDKLIKICLKHQNVFQELLTNAGIKKVTN